MNLKSNYSQIIKTEAFRLGFSSVGISKSDFLEEEAPKFETWLKNDYHGKMKYMENYFDKRLDTRLLVEGSKSVISLTYNYFPKQQQVKDSYKIAKYAYGDDYHTVIKDKLRVLLAFINENIGEVNGRAFTDSAPVMERVWASKSGLGWQGKNSLFLQKDKGSFFFLAELIIDLELLYDSPFKTNHCGTCTKCIVACPTQAILPNNVVNGSRCISYLTIELKDRIPTDFKGIIPDWIFGCDICQDVCPWNSFSIPHDEAYFNPHPDLLNMTKSDWHEITEEIFLKTFRNSAIKRTKYKGLTSNINFLKNI